jgi:hypothetical protein
VDPRLSGLILARQIAEPFGIFEAWQTCHVVPSVVSRLKYCHTQLVEVRACRGLLVVADESIISISDTLDDTETAGELCLCCAGIVLVSLCASEFLHVVVSVCGGAGSCCQLVEEECSAGRVNYA